VSGLPEEGERLLAVAPAEFVAERGRVARELRDAGRLEDAEAVAALRKPSLVVLAVNRAARDRPQVARDAAAAAEQVLATQLAGDADAYRAATRDLERALELLADVALAHAAPSGKTATEATARRVRDLLRAAASDPEGRPALARGALLEELEAAGFAALAGAVPAPAARKPRRRSGEVTGETAAKKRERDRKRARAQELRGELAEAEAALREAERSLKRATQEHERAAKKADRLREALERM
jgi:hypothetical protein